MASLLVPSASTDETKVSYYRMKSDYYRYLAEFATGETKSKADEDALDACVEANKIAENDLAVTHPVRLAMALSSLDDVSVVAQRQIFMDQTVQKTVETPQLQRTDTVIDGPVMQIEHVPPFQVRNTSYRDEVTSQATEKKEDLEADTAKHSSVLETAVTRSTLDGEVSSRDRISQYTMEQTLDVSMPEMVKQLAEVPETASPDRIQQRTVEQIVDALVPQAVEELAEVSRVFSQNGIQQRAMEQNTPAISLAGKIVEMPVTQQTQQLVNTHVQHVVNTVEVEMLKVVKKTVQEKINQVTKHVKVPQVQVVAETAEIPQVQFLNKVDEMPVGVQRQIPMIPTVQKTMENPQSQCIDEMIDVPVVSVVQAPRVQVSEKTVEIPQLQIVDVPGSQTQEETVPQDRTSDRVVQQTVKELKSKFEVGHKNKVHARNQLDKNRWRKKQEFEATQYPQDVQERADLTNQRQVPAIRSVQKTVEVPRVQYIDKVADIPVDMQRQVSTTQAAQDIEEVEDVPALTQSEVPNIPDDDEDCLEQESKRRKIPTPADAVSESRADESDFDRFDDLVLPSPEGKTIFMSIASGDEAEDGSDKEQEMTQCLVQGGKSMLVDETDAESPGRQMVQVVHAEWSQELREVQKKFADDMASEMTDVKNELAHVREMLGVLVRRERSAETKAEIAARRLDRMEREQHEADDAEHEANLQEALANQSKAVKVLVDKWFVDKGYGFGKAPTGEIVFIHASAVQGAEVLTIGTDAWVQVVNDDARAQGGTEQREPGGETRGRPRGTRSKRTKWPNK